LVGEGGSSAAALGARRGCGPRLLVARQVVGSTTAPRLGFEGFWGWCAERALLLPSSASRACAAWASGVGSLMVGGRFFFLVVDKMHGTQFFFFEKGR
jgi:hypothetical protein